MQWKGQYKLIDDAPQMGWYHPNNSKTIPDETECQLDHPRGCDLEQRAPPPPPGPPGPCDPPFIRNPHGRCCDNFLVCDEYCTPGEKGALSLIALAVSLTRESLAISGTPCAASCPACAVCTKARPCLYDILKDPGERNNLAAAMPQVVAQLAKQLATYVPYVDGKMTPEALAKYECVPANADGTHPWWGNFSGPCCRPKKA